MERTGDCGRAPTTTARLPSPFDLAVRPWIRWIPTIAASALLGLWLVSAVAQIGDAAVLAWAAARRWSSAGSCSADRAWLAPWAIAGLAAAALVPVPRAAAQRPRRVRDDRDSVDDVRRRRSAPAIGRFTIYDFGHDYWMYQRFAYRIVMQGYWLEGGSATF